MSLLNEKNQQLAKEEFSRDRDNLTSIYLSQTTSILDGARGVSDKQFNLNIALATISAAIIGILIPMVQTSPILINPGLFRTAVIIMSFSLILDLTVSFGAIYYDRWILDKHTEKINSYFKQLTDSTNIIIDNARNNILTEEDIKNHHITKDRLNTNFRKMEGKFAQDLLNYGYYIYIGLFLLALFLIFFTFFHTNSINKQPLSSPQNYSKINKRLNIHKDHDSFR